MFKQAKDLKEGDVVIDRSRRFTVKRIIVNADTGMISIVNTDDSWHGEYHPEEYLGVIARAAIRLSTRPLCRALEECSGMGSALRRPMPRPDGMVDRKLCLWGLPVCVRPARGSAVLGHPPSDRRAALHTMWVGTTNQKKEKFYVDIHSKLRVLLRLRGVLESFVPLRGHIECQRCFDGECVNDHYYRTHRLCGAQFEDTTCARIEGHAGEHQNPFWAVSKRSQQKLRASEDAMKAFAWGVQQIFKAPVPQK
jgi:hypothetical protein